MTDTIYITGISDDGYLLYGGIWTHFHQNGFPIELSNLAVQGIGKVDWMEAMMDASITNNCPNLMEHLEIFMDNNTLIELKLRFVALIKHTSPTQFISDKRKNGEKFDNFVKSKTT